MKSRRWFRFSLRTMLVLVTLVGITIGWTGMQLKWIRDRQEAIRWLESSADPNDTDGAWRGGRQYTTYESYQNSNAPWSLRLFGERGIDRLHIDKSALRPNDRHQARDFEKLFPEARIRIYDGATFLYELKPTTRPTHS